MTNEKRDLNSMPVVEVLNLIIDGKLKGDAVAGILRDATDATHFAYAVLDARLALIARAREVVIYGKDGRPDTGSSTTANEPAYVTNYRYSLDPLMQAVQPTQVPVVGSQRKYDIFGMPVRN